MLRLYGYGRSSTDDQKDTITAQEQRILAEYDHRFRAEGFAWGGFYADQGVSGSVPLRNRPQGLLLSNSLRRGDVVVITKLDRGFRNTLDFLQTLDAWSARGVRLVLLDMQLDSGTPVGRMLAGILSSVAEFERSRALERTREIIAERRRKGLPITGRPPYGYKIVGPKGARQLVPDPSAREVGARVVEWIDSGWSFDAVYFHLLGNRILRGQQRTEWSRTAITRAYEGERRLAALEAEGLSPEQALLRIMQQQHEDEGESDSESDLASDAGGG